MESGLERGEDAATAVAQDAAHGLLQPVPSADDAAGKGTEVAHGSKSPVWRQMLPPTPTLPSCSGTPLLYPMAPARQPQAGHSRLLSSGNFMMSPPIGMWPPSHDASPLFSFPSPSLSGASLAPSPAMQQQHPQQNFGTAPQFPVSTRYPGLGAQSMYSPYMPQLDAAHFDNGAVPIAQASAVGGADSERGGDLGARPVGGAQHGSGALPSMFQNQQVQPLPSGNAGFGQTITPSSGDGGTNGTPQQQQYRPTLLERVTATSGQGAQPHQQISDATGAALPGMTSSEQVATVKAEVVPKAEALRAEPSVITPPERTLSAEDARRKTEAAVLSRKERKLRLIASRAQMHEKEAKDNAVAIMASREVQPSAGAVHQYHGQSVYVPRPQYEMTALHSGHNEAAVQQIAPHHACAQPSREHMAVHSQVHPQVVAAAQAPHYVAAVGLPSVPSMSGGALQAHPAHDEDATRTGTTSCPECTASFRYKSRMFFHLFRDHGRSELYPCTVCESAFKRKSELRKHMNCVHEKYRPFQCTICPSGFYFRKDLRKHVSTVHEKARPFGCPHCSHSFGKKEHLKRHLLLIHEDASATSPILDKAGAPSSGASAAKTSAPGDSGVIAVAPH